MRTILITGANGFVGSHTLQFLSQQPDLKLIAACRNKAALPSFFRGEVREGDLLDNAYVGSLLKGVDVVVHAAAWTALWGHRQRSDKLFLKPTLNLINKYFASSASLFVNISSTAAAAPHHSADPMSIGIERQFWPHLINVVRIENELRHRASSDHAVANMRLGLFAGTNYSIGLLPILLPRLKTHLVPWVGDGRTTLDITDGRDIGQGIGLAAMKDDLEGYESFNIIGPQSPTVRELIGFLHQEVGTPMPHFGVSFPMAYRFARLMEWLNPIVPWEPLIVRSIVHLLEGSGADSNRAASMLGYKPLYNWREAVHAQVKELNVRQRKPMSMAKPSK